MKKQAFGKYLLCGLLSTILAASIASASVVYEYDDLGRLIKATYGVAPNDKIIEYTYDAAGNRSVVGVTGDARPFTAVADSISLSENTTHDFDPRANDTTDPGTTIDIYGASDGAYGTVELIGGGTQLRYTPNTNFDGSDAFTYVVTDGSVTANAAVSVTVTGVNHAPNVVNDALTVLEETTGSLDPRVNDSDPEGAAITITGKTDGAKGVVTIQPGGVGVDYAPNANESGADSFTYTVSDGSLTAQGTVNVTITGVNDPPSIDTDPFAISTDEDVIKIFTPPASDPDPSDTLTVASVTNGAKGTTTTFAGGTQIRYIPNQDANGSDTFFYAMTDGTATTATATVNVTINAINDPPVAVNDSISVVYGQDKQFDPRTNDSDVESAITIQSASGATKGSLSNTTTQVTYTHGGTSGGSDSFSYTISDGSLTDSATVSVTITNTAPVAVDDNNSSLGYTATNINPGQNYTLPVRNNDTDADGHAITIVSTTQPTGAIVSIINSGADLSIIPTTAGIKTFTYTIEDIAGAQDTATANVTVFDDGGGGGDPPPAPPPGGGGG